jgi:hypothetical protein
MRDEYMARNEQTAKLTQKRKLNEEPEAKSGNPFSKQVELTCLYDRRTDIDIKLAEHRPEVYDQMLLADAQDLVQDIDYDIFNGVPDDSGYGMRGLKDRIPVANAGYDVNNGADLVINTSATTFKTFLRLFRKAKDKIKLAPGQKIVCFCNESVDQAISSGRDELGANVVGVGTMDILNQRVNTVDNIPLLKVRKDTVGTEILAFDEGTSTTSLFICAIGGGPAEDSKQIPNGMVILSGSDGVIQKRSHQTLAQIQTMQEMEMGLRVPKGSVVRLSRLKVA